MAHWGLLHSLLKWSATGCIASAVLMPHVTMLEFWVDPESPYFKPVFGEDKTFVIHCASGWRSTLATEVLQRMGLERVKNMSCGFAAWKAAGGAVEQVERK